MSGFDHPIQPCSFTASVPAFDSNNDYAGAHLCPLFVELTGEKTYKSTSATIANEPSIKTRRTTHVKWICAMQTQVHGPDSANPLPQHQHTESPRACRESQSYHCYIHCHVMWLHPALTRTSRLDSPWVLTPWQARSGCVCLWHCSADRSYHPAMYYSQ
jgi:hypothetical protein